MKSMRSLYKKLFHYVQDKRIWAYFSMALSAAAVCSYMGAYWFLWQSIVSILVIPVYEKAMYDAIIVVILMILRGILNIASATCSHYLGFRLETNLRKTGLHKLLDASSSFFDHNSSGEIRKIIDDNAAETHKTVAHLIPDNVTAVMTPVLMFVLMFAIDYRLGILLILTTVIGVLQYRKMSGGTEFLSGYSAALQKMSAATVEYVRGMQIIKIFGVTVQYYKTLINSIKEYKQYVYQYSLSCKNPYVGFQVLFNVFYAFAVPAAVVFISYGEPAMLTLAKIVFFAVFSGAVFTSFTSIMFTGQDNFGAQNTLNQLDELTTSMDQAKLPHGNEETFQDFNIEFRHVDFKYDDNFVLKDFSLTLHQNKTYALIGSSGGGKSTIAKLISGFYPVDGGEILIGGKNIQSYSEKALIQNIAFVFQRSQLLKTSIYENVRIGNPQATRQQIMDLAKVGTIISQVTDILTAPELSRPETDTESPQGSTVELRDVHFGYNDAEVLHGIDLVFPEGTVNALVGPSGSGKSTIAKLIASFWDVGSGSITVGGADIRSISAEHYNKLVAYVSQDNFLFDNTVRENIRMGRPDATDAEVEQAARDCGCYDFIMSLENGFNTQVGSGGGHLSGGEKQRISIARAMLKNAPIVILDEATAYTDPENEAIIQESVARLVRGKTLIVIAHRLSTIVDADQIVVVNDGCIEATGTQAELLQACPLYETLWNAHIASRDSAEGGADRA